MPNEIRTDWNLAALYQSFDDPEIEVEKKAIETAIDGFVSQWRDNPDYLEKPAELLKALDQYEQLNWHTGSSGKAGYYLWLSTELDQLDTELKAKFNKMIEFSERNSNKILFFGLNLAKVSAEKQAEFLAAPELQKYRHYLESLFAVAKYHLSEKEEKILSLMGQPAGAAWTRMTEEFLSSEEREITRAGKKELLPFSTIISLITDTDKTVRDQAGAFVHEINAKYASIAEHELNAILLEKKIDDELRGLNRPDEGRHIGDDIDSSVVDAMLTAVEKQFTIAQDFYALKAQLLGQEKLAYHERGVEIGSLPDDYDAAKSVALVQKVLGELDPEFQEIFEMMLANGQLDFYPKKGKSGGAFCVMDLPSQPTFVLLNHTNKLRDVTTLAHEMGHAVNDEMMKKHQHALYCGTSLAIAEVASTFVEDFVLEEVASEAGDEHKLAILMMKLNDDISTIFRQVAAYRFEQQLHAAFRDKGYLSKTEIGALFQKNMAAYMGPAVTQDPGSENWWVYWSHFRRFFYVYSYASGLLISKALQNKVRADKKFVEKVKEFLSAGSSDSPKNIFAALGIDITDDAFWQLGLAEVENLLTEAKTLAKKLGKI